MFSRVFADLQLIKLLFSFTIFKWRVAKGLSTRCDLSFREILLLLIPSTLLVASGSIYYSLQRTFEDELVIQVLLCHLFHVQSLFSYEVVVTAIISYLWLKRRYSLRFDLI